jgi:uncharacterized protein (DUF427 family)
MTLTLDVDFGTIAPSETTERVIQLPNSFSSSVKPMNVVSSCKCLDALVEKRSYVPGEKISVRVLVQTSSHTSTINQRLEISMDDAQETKYVLRVRARVQGAFDVRPSGVLLKSGQESFVDVFNFSGKAWATPSVYAKAEWIQLELVPESRHETDTEIEGATQHWRFMVKSALESVDPEKHASVVDDPCDSTSYHKKTGRRVRPKIADQSKLCPFECLWVLDDVDVDPIDGLP